MTREELIKYMEDNDASNLLDEEVHDSKSAEASDINNEGPTAQVDYLLSRGYDLSTIAVIVMDEEDYHPEHFDGPEEKCGPEPEDTE